MTNVNIAQTAYEAYAAHTGGRAFDGRQMPAWDDLGATQHAWEAAAQAVRANVTAVPPAGESADSHEHPAKIEP